MNFLSKLVAPYRKGEKNCERGRAAEARRDISAAKAYFETGAEAFDVHFAKQKKAGKDVRTPHLVRAGICYTRLGRNDDALRVLDKALERKEIPDAFLHAGYAAAKQGKADKAVDYWSHYPNWADQRIISNALTKQVTALREQESPDLQTACEAVVEAVFQQEKQNASARLSARGKKTVPARRGY